MGASIGAALGPLDVFGTRAQERRDANGRRLINAFDSVPEFERITDSQGNLRNNLSIAGAGRDQINQAGRSLNRLEGLTNFGQGTPIAQRLLEVQNTANQQAVNNIAGQQAGQLAQGVSALARQGGISGGARERLAANSFNQGLLARQNQAFQNQQTQQRISADDAQRQLGILQQLPGQRQNIANFERAGTAADVANAIGDIQSASQDRTQRAAARSEALLNNANTPKGGLGGTVSGILGK